MIRPARALGKAGLRGSGAVHETIDRNGSRARARHGRRLRSSLAGKTRAHHRTIRGRLNARPRGAPDRRSAQATNQADIHCREQAGRQWQYRHRCGGQVRTRRNDDRHQHRRTACHQHSVVRQPALRSKQGSVADHHAGDAAQRTRGQCQSRCRQRAGTDRADPQESRKVQLRVDRHRLAVAAGHGGDRAQERHEARTRPLPLVTASGGSVDP